MKLPIKVLVFDPDASLRELLKVYLGGLGYDVQAFKDPTICPLFQQLWAQDCSCNRREPCADAVIIDLNMPQINAFDFLRRQRERGCKTLDRNKALMSTSITRALEKAMAEFGCHHLRKPFRLVEVKDWLETCAEGAPAQGND